MSILNRPNNERQLPPPATRIAARLKNQTIQTFKGLLGVHEEGIRSFWKNPQASPQEIAAELGTDALEIFSLHAKLGEFLSQFDADKVNEIKALVGEFTANPDGTITVPTPPAAT